MSNKYQPEPVTYLIQKLPDIPTPFIPREPKIKVSPYAKFDKFHRKKKKK